MFFSKKNDTQEEKPKWSITEQFLTDNENDKQYPLSKLQFAKQKLGSKLDITVWYECNYLCNISIPCEQAYIFQQYSLKECEDYIPSFESTELKDINDYTIYLTSTELTLNDNNYGLSGLRTEKIDSDYALFLYGHKLTTVNYEAAQKIELAKHVYLSRKYGLPNSKLKNYYQAQKLREQEASKLENINQQAVLLTTETHPSLKIAKRLDVITAECAYGMNVFKDIFVSLSDTFGGRSSSIQNTLRDARKVVLDELRKEALSIGANAVIAVDLDYSEISGGGKNGMLFLVASGTAVILDKE
ncbi:YbjQ family protein (plasmid) [Pseudoalteromonas sp. T1lg65]|uniref:YbjQ family protein n=1 Tax=Pseudoalteromonas sp. T1lg65 TaxID=2077101 RepID=UPI003F7B032B